MKKGTFIVGIFFTIATTLFFVSMFEKDNLKEYDNLVNMYNKENTVKVLLSVKYQEQEQAYNILKDYLDTNNGNIYSHYTSSQSGKTITKIYTYFTEETFFNHIKLVSGRYFSLDENESEKFLSTKKTNEADQIGRIADFAGDHEIEIHTLRNKMNEPDTNIFDKYLYISAGKGCDKETFYEGLVEVIKEYGYTINKADNTFINDKNSYYNLIILAGLSALYIICMLFTYYDILNSYKKIGIEKMLGYSNISIWKKSISPLILTQLISMVLTTVILVIIKFKVLNIYLIFFVLKLFIVYGLLVLISIILLSIPFITIRKISISSMIKNKNPVKTITLINSAFKVVLSIIILFIITDLYEQHQSIKNEYAYSFENWEKTEGYAVIPYIRVRREIEYNAFSKENRYKDKELYFYFNERGALLANFMQYHIAPDRSYLNKKVNENYAEVNPNYLKENIVFGTDGERIYIDENETEYILLVPEVYKKHITEIINYHESQKNSRGVHSDHTQEEITDPHELPAYKEPSIVTDQKIKIIWIQTDQKMFSYKLDIKPEQNNVVIDPIIRVITESNGDLFDYTHFLMTSSMPVKIKFDGTQKGIEQIKSVLANYYDPNSFLFSVTNLYTMVDDQIHEFRMKIFYSSAIIVVVFAILFLIILQNILNYFNQHRLRLAIQKFHGYKTVDKYRGYFILISLHWLIVLFIFMLILRSAFSVLVVSIFFLLEYAISILALRKTEKLKVLNVTKGGFQ